MYRALPPPSSWDARGAESISSAVGKSSMSQIDPNSFLTGGNAAFIAELYARYLEAPSEVDEGWRRFFAELHDAPPAVEKEISGPSWSRDRARILGNGHANGANGANGHAAVLPGDSATLRLHEIRRAPVDSIRPPQLIHSHRRARRPEAHTP